MYINEQINKQKISTSKKETITCNIGLHCMTNEYLYIYVHSKADGRASLI